jgi:hypothetical protein
MPKVTRQGGPSNGWEPGYEDEQTESEAVVVPEPEPVVAPDPVVAPGPEPAPVVVD